MVRFEEVGANLGVDSKQPGHEWMTIPQGGDNLVLLVDGDGFQVTETGQPARLTITEVTTQRHAEILRLFGPLGVLVARDGRAFRVTGRHTGLTEIVARKGSDSAKLPVSVHPKRTFKIAFYFLQDTTGRGVATARTAFTPSVASEWVEALNKVYGRQANIWFSLARTDFLPLLNLGAYVGSATDLAVFGDVRKKSGAEIAVFVAGPRIQPRPGDEPLGFFDPGSKAIVVQDQFMTDPWSPYAAPMIKTIAHEIGHFMNDLRHSPGGHEFFKESGYNSDVLNTLDGSNIKIPHQRVLNWNPW